MSTVESPFRHFPSGPTPVERTRPHLPQAVIDDAAILPPDELTTQVIPISEAADYAGEWNALADRAAEPNPFCRPDFLLPIVAYLQPNNPRLLFIRKKGRLTGILPLVKDKAGFGLSGKKPALYYHHYGPVGAPIIDRDLVDETLSALFPPKPGSSIQSPRKSMRCLPAGLLVHLDENGPIYQSLCRLAEQYGRTPIVLDRFQRAALDARQDRDHFFKHSLMRKKRKDLSRLFRRLQEEGQVNSFAHRDPSAIAGALERFIALEARSWKGRRETALGSESGRTQLALELVNEFAAKDQARIDEITVDGLLVASLISFIDCDRLFTWKIAHHEEFARFSPGSQIIVKLSETLLADPAITFADSLATPDHPMIDHIWRDRISVVKAYIPLRRPSRLAASCMRADERAYGFARATAKRLITATRSRIKKAR